MPQAWQVVVASGFTGPKSFEEKRFAEDYNSSPVTVHVIKLWVFGRFCVACESEWQLLEEMSNGGYTKRVGVSSHAEVQLPVCVAE